MKIQIKKGGFQKKLILILLGLIILSLVFYFTPAYGQKLISNENLEKTQVLLNSFVLSNGYEAKLYVSDGRKLKLKLFRNNEILWEKDSPSEFIHPLDNKIIVLSKKYEKGFVSDVATPDGFYLYNISGNLIKKANFDELIQDFKVTKNGEFAFLVGSIVLFFDKNGEEKWRLESDATYLEIDDKNNLLLLVKPIAIPQSWQISILTFGGKEKKKLFGKGIAPIFASKQNILAFREQSDPSYKKWKVKILNTIDFSESLSLDFDVTPASISFSEDKISILTRKPINKETVSEKLTVHNLKGTKLIDKKLGSVPLNSHYSVKHVNGKFVAYSGGKKYEIAG